MSRRQRPPRKLTGVGQFTERPKLVRSSNLIAALRKLNPEGARQLEGLREKVGRQCPTHGYLDDPILGIMNNEAAFGCPHCSSPDILAQWLAEPVPDEETS